MRVESKQTRNRELQRLTLDEDIVSSCMRIQAGVLAHRVCVANILDNKRKITLITPHQLSTDAKMLIREGRQNFVQELPGKGFYDKCKTVDNEVDIEIFFHIEKVNGKSYLTIQRGKHRLNGQTPDQDLYLCLEFLPNGVILDDINGPDSSRRRPGAAPIGGTEKQPFWEME